MNRIFALLLSFAYICIIQAQTVQTQVIDAKNNIALLTTDYLPFCQKGLLQSKEKEQHTLSLNYYINKKDSYYILCIPVITDEKQEVRRGTKLKLVVQPRDTVRLSCSSNFISKDSLVVDGVTRWITYPKYHCSEATLRQLIDGNVTCLVQELAKGKTLRISGDDYGRWRFSKTLSNYYKVLSKEKTRSADSDMFYNNGRYEYLNADSIVKTDQRISFSEEWMF